MNILVTKNYLVSPQNTIFACTVINNKAIMIYSGLNNWDYACIFDLTTKQLVFDEDWIEYGTRFLYFPETKYLYYIDAHVSPIDICYFAMNDELTSFEEGNSPYHGDYSLYNPMARLGNSMFFVTGAGNLFSAEADNKSKIEFVSTFTQNNFTAVDSDETYFYIAVYEDNYSSPAKCRIEKRSIQNPETVLVTSEEIENEKGKALYISGNKIILITNSSSPVFDDLYSINVYEYNTSLRALN